MMSISVCMCFGYICARTQPVIFESLSLMLGGGGDYVMLEIASGPPVLLLLLIGLILFWDHIQWFFSPFPD